jgi:anhydro-N-acetylmuramic acid kinase
MSGTSLDGADVVLVDLGNDSIALLAQHNQPYPAALHQALEQLIVERNTSTGQLAGLDRQLGLFYADAIGRLLADSGTAAHEIRAIGNHGQTVFHDPDGAYPSTLQLGDPSSIAAGTGITTVAHLRQMDMAYGGQGAPLACAFHQNYLASPDESRAVVNIGGIANVTLLQPGEPVLGFDTGPGNTLMDAWHRQHRDGNFDAQGEWAASGQVNQSLLGRLQAEPYFARPHPKSTGRELFNLPWLERALAELPGLPAADVQTTLAELTATSIVKAIRGTGVKRLLVCGGGKHNRYLENRLQALAGETVVEPTDAWGIPADWLEAMAFAWLAWARLNQTPGNVSSVTGARQNAVLGGVYLPG